MPIWHQSPKLTPRYFLETPRLFGYPKNIHIDNMYLQELKKKYPLVFELSIRVGEILNEELEIDISENELGF